MKPYGKEIAKKIIDSRIDEFNVKKKGVFPKDDRPSSESEFDFCTWRPACELGKQAGGELRKKPGLPIPFDANELAAFFLHGWGWYVRDSFGSWDDGPDDAAFDKIDSLERDEVKDAVNGAFHAYREAVNILGHFDNSLVVEAQELEDAFWNADASLSKAELSESLRIAQEKANGAESAWRKKMVNQLLKVATLPLAPKIPALAQTATPAPVVDANLNHTPNDQERRLTLLRELGGNAKYTHCEWKFTGIKALVDREKSDGRKRCDEKTIRADLKDAAQNERDSKAAGVFTGLGQR